MESNIIPIAIVPSIAHTATIIASAIIPFGKSLAGSFVLLTYGEIFSHPPTANTRMDKFNKNFISKDGMNVFIDQSISNTFAFVIAGAAIIITMNNRDMINIVEPANVDSFFNTLMPLDATHIANKNSTRHAI